jgi:hypothetical protein
LFDALLALPMIPPWLYEDLEGLVDDVSVGDELAVFLPEDGADAFWVGFNLLELKSDVVDIRNYTLKANEGKTGSKNQQPLIFPPSKI